jgi:hypothetical protein
VPADPIRYSILYHFHKIGDATIEDLTAVVTDADVEQHIVKLVDYLNSQEAKMWTETHCQKAHNAYYRL